MNTVIKKISEIEDAASAIMESANASKKAFAQEMEVHIREFDQDLEVHTNQGIEEFRKRMEAEMDQKLEQQRLESDRLLQKMEQDYEKSRSQYIGQLFQELTGE
ncbi:ATPase [Clostridiaceae bacterium]|nr:ATPase [Clostridiaceae bacterium]RKI13788.1 ATPase [bacterium 1XD21-70]